MIPASIARTAARRADEPRRARRFPARAQNWGLSGGVERGGNRFVARARRLAAESLAALALAACAAAAPPADADDPTAFTAEERARILSLGPWPPPFAPDPSNRASGRPEAVALGARLFFDARLSPDGRIACVSCHQPDRGWSDGRPRARGRTDLPRNTMAVVNLQRQRWYGWGGGADSLWMASLRPLLDAREFAADAAVVARLYDRDADLACRYALSFGQAADAADPQRVLVNTAKALAAFQETLTTGRTAFDAFRDALARGDAAAAARYPAAARRGLRLFVGRGNCVACHNGPTLSNGEFADVGVPYFVAPGVVDPGRHADLQQLRASRYNRLGPYDDDAGAGATATRHARLEPRHWGEFKVPGLRNVALTAPYFHNGSAASLRDVLRHYSELDESRIHASAQPLLRALRLSAAETDDLLAFLESLTAPVAPHPMPPGDADCAAPGAQRR